jgi:hypothetical protein
MPDSVFIDTAFFQRLLDWQPLAAAAAVRLSVVDAAALAEVVRARKLLLS